MRLPRQVLEGEVVDTCKAALKIMDRKGCWNEERHSIMLGEKDWDNLYGVIWELLQVGERSSSLTQRFIQEREDKMLADLRSGYNEEGGCDYV